MSKFKQRWFMRKISIKCAYKLNSKRIFAYILRMNYLINTYRFNIKGNTFINIAIYSSNVYAIGFI